MNAIGMRKVIVERLERINNKYDVPVYWRIRDDIVERGKEHGYYIVWKRVEFLSTYLLNERRVAQEMRDDSLPF